MDSSELIIRDDVGARRLLGVTDLDNGSKYLVRAPWGDGDFMQVWRFIDYDGDSDDDPPFCTNHLPIFKVDGDGGEKKLVEASPASLEDHVLFLGHEFSACFPAEQFSALKPECAYLVDDCHENVYMRKNCRRDIGRWDMRRGQMEGLADDDGGGVAPPSQPWLN